MFQRVRSLILVAVLIITSNAYAGGGPPQTFADLKYMAEQNLKPQIDYYNLSGQLQYWAATPCVGWTNLTDGLMYYFMNEAKFRSAAVQTVTTNTWAIKLAQQTGQNLNLVPSFKLKRLKAQQQIALMDQWHAEFDAFYFGTAWGLRTFYCSQEQMCVQPSEPEFSTVSVSTFPTPPVVYAGYGQVLFGFSLAMVSGDPLYDEGGQLSQIVLLMFVTNDQYANLHNCELISGGFTVSYTGGPDFSPGDKFGELVFNVDGLEIPKSSGAAFTVKCDILTPLEANTVIQTGFFASLGSNPPNDAIVMYGSNTAEKLEVFPNEDIYHIVSYY